MVKNDARYRWQRQLRNASANRFCMKHYGYQCTVHHNWPLPKTLRDQYVIRFDPTKWSNI